MLTLSSHFLLLLPSALYDATWSWISLWSAGLFLPVLPVSPPNFLCTPNFLAGDLKREAEKVFGLCKNCSAVTKKKILLSNTAPSINPKNSHITATTKKSNSIPTKTSTHSQLSLALSYVMFIISSHFNSSWVYWVWLGCSWTSFRATCMVLCFGYCWTDFQFIPLYYPIIQTGGEQEVRRRCAWDSWLQVAKRIFCKIQWLGYFWSAFFHYQSYVPIT